MKDSASIFGRLVGKAEIKSVLRIASWGCSETAQWLKSKQDRVVRIPGAHVSAGDSPVTPGLEGRKRRSLEALPG